MHDEAVADQAISLAAEIAGGSTRMAPFGVNRCRFATFSQPKDVRLCRYPEGLQAFAFAAGSMEFLVEKPQRTGLVQRVLELSGEQ
jgi:hypothetical protein